MICFKPKTIIFVLLIFLSSLSQLFSQINKAKIDSINNLPVDKFTTQPRICLDILKQNLEGARSINYKYGEARTLINIGFVEYVLGNYDQNTAHNLEGIKLFEDLNLYKELADSYAQFGFQLKRREINKAKKYMRMAINLGEKYNLLPSLSSIYDNYGIVLEIDGSIDSAVHYYKKGLQLKKTLNDIIGIPYSLNHLAGANTFLGNYNNAILYLKESDEYRDNQNGLYGKAENLVMWGDLYFVMHKFKSSKTKYLAALSIAKKISNKYMITYCYDYLSKISENLNLYESAFNYAKLYNVYNDSLVNIETNKRIAELEIDYESEKKDRQIAENKLQIRARNTLLFSALGIIIFLLFLSTLIYRFQKMKRERIKKELELSKKLKQAELDKLISNEKLRVSRDLHDNIGSNLTFLISSIDNLSFIETSKNIKKKLSKLSNYGRDTLTELRNTIWAMNSEDGDLNKLILKITELKKNINEQLSELNLEIINDCNTQIILSSSSMLNIFRIVQESVQNSIKYAEATSIKIIFNCSQDYLTIKIIDDGKGFEINNAKDGNGLKNMHYRCKQSNGKFSIKSSPCGTEIECNFILK